MSDHLTATTGAHTGIAHPAVTDRLVEDIGSLALLLDQAPAATFAADVPWAALQHLAESVDTLMRHAELHRPSLA